MIKTSPNLKHEWVLWHSPEIVFCTLCNLEMKVGARWEEYDQIWNSDCVFKIRNPPKEMEVNEMEPCCDCPCCAEKPCGTKCCDKH